MELEPWRLYLLPYGKNSSLSRFSVLKKLSILEWIKVHKKATPTKTEFFAEIISLGSDMLIVQ